MKKFMSVKNILMTLALVILSAIAMSSVAAMADDFTVTYDSAKDELTASTGGYIYVLKSKESTTIKAKTSPLSISSGSAVNLVSKAKCKEGANAYFYVSATKLTEDKQVTPNFVIEAPDYKKYAVSIDYYATTSGSAIYSFTGTKDDVTKDFVTKKTAHDDEPGSGVEYSTDGKKWTDANDSSVPLNGAVLKEYYGKTLYLRVKGADGANGTAKRASKAIKVKLGKQAVLKAVKIDVSKGTVALKNGMDFRVFAVTTTPSAIKVEDVITGSAANAAWNTILPTNRDGKVTKLEDSVVGTGDFWPCSPKVEANLVYFTTEKIKAMKIADLTDGNGKGWNTTNSILIEARTSATEKKPCSKPATVVVPKQAAAPVANYGEDEDGDPIKSVTSSALVFKAPTLSKDDADTAPAKFEMLVVDLAKDKIDSIDFSASKFKAVKSGAAKAIKEDAKFKWVDNTGESKETSVSEGCLVIIRRAADKRSNNAASEYIVLSITKSGEDYKIEIE